MGLDKRRLTVTHSPDLRPADSLYIYIVVAVFLVVYSVVYISPSKLFIGKKSGLVLPVYYTSCMY